MTKRPYSRWLTWPVTAFLLAGCVFSPPVPNPAPPLPAEAKSAAPLLIPANRPSSEASSTTTLTPAQQQLLSNLPALGAAPDLQNETWLNSDPLQLTALRGKVVMIEFWTFG